MKIKTQVILRAALLVSVAFSLVVFTGCGDDGEDCPKFTYYKDADGDGLGDPNSIKEDCSLPTGYVENANDDNDNSAPSQTIGQIAAASSDLSDLVKFVSRDPALAAILSGSTKHTIFAPNNNAFDKLLVTLGLDSLEQVAPDVIAAVLRFHFHVGVKYADDLKSLSPVVTLQGESIAFADSVGNLVISTGGSDANVQILATNINASNGVIHKVETILIPPTVFAAIGQNLGRLSQPILLSSSFTDVADLIAIADSQVPSGETSIAGVLADLNNKYTVFAPANSVLDGVAASLSITKEQLIGSIIGSEAAQQPARARGFLLNHVTNEQLKAADLTNGDTLTMLSGLKLVLTAVPQSANTPTGWVLISTASPTTPYPIFAGDAYKAVVEGQTLDGALNGSLHVSAPITK